MASLRHSLCGTDVRCAGGVQTRGVVHNNEDPPPPQQWACGWLWPSQRTRAATGTSETFEPQTFKCLRSTPPFLWSFGHPGLQLSGGGVNTAPLASPPPPHKKGLN